ncbi:tripartite tricarboxylate transporter TctB family protein [Castellaniella sp.]|uniref:tripartite tricarboxylate transporter TctB family protein n=1 Tax=Castellaniella sp. TaxID=1955812 RepID=UPI002AFFC23C|nr:tripartite tricarboxylate transporter TctB family protein [Castellaniella sp.]
MDRIKKREVTVGAIMLACGLGYMALTSQIPHVKNQYGFVDATFVPYVLSAIMCLLGILQILTIRQATEGTTPEASGADQRTVFKTIALIIAYVALLEPLGFLLATVLYLVIQFTMLTPADKKPNLPLYVLIAVLTSGITYAIFRYAFDMVLPVGIFGA